MEISDYAIENTCAKGYVLKGDVRNIPFKDNSFDLVHSQGLWEYIPKEDVDKAFAECQELYDVCEKGGLDYYTIRDAVYGWCAWAESLGYDPKITKAILEKNREWIK